MIDQVSFEDPVANLLSRLLSRTERGIENRQTSLAELESKMSVLKAEKKRLSRAKSVLKMLLAENARGNRCEVVRQIDGAKDLGVILDQFSEGTSADIAHLRASAVERAAESLSELSSALPAALESAGLTLDPSSRFPLFKLRNGFFEVMISEPMYEARITVRHGTTPKVAADVNIIVDAMVAQDTRCFGAVLDPAVFVARLRAAYALALEADKPRPLPLEDVRQAIAEPTPPRDEFAVALAAVMRDRPAEAIGMNLDHTRTIDTGFLLPGFEDRGYYGHISFTSL